MLINTIKETLKEAIKTNNNILKITTRMILGEIPRLNKKANEIPTDSEIYGIVRKLIKNEKDNLSIQKLETSDYLECLECFLPQMVPKEEIEMFIKTLDFSKFKNKMQAVSVVKNHFGSHFVDSELVKQIINNM